MARVEDEWRDGVRVARLEGEIDSSNVEDIRGRLRSLVTNESQALVVDLSATDYLDSAGINMLFAFGDEMRSHQLRMALVVREGAPIGRMLSITGLDRAVEMFTSVDAAL
jgi:anti-sigma B factor antagonist